MLVVTGTLGIFGMVFHLAQLLGYSSYTPVAHGIFHSERSGLNHAIGRQEFLLQDIRNRILLFESGAGLHGLESFFVIESSDALQDSIRDDRHRAITRHTFCFAIVQSPDRQLVLLAIDREHGVHDTAYSFRLSQCHQRLQSTVSVPQRKGAVVFLGRRGVNHIVHASVLAIHVAIGRRSNHGVIMSGVEDSLVGFILTFYGNLLQLFVPLFGTCLYYLIKVPVVQFSLQVHGCIFATYRRKGYLELYLLYIAEGQCCLQGRSLPLVLRLGYIIVVCSEVFYLLVGLQYEIHLAVRSPVVAITITLDGVIVYLAYITHAGLGV